MFWQKKTDQGKQTAPKPIPDMVQKYLVSEKKREAEWLPFLKAVVQYDAGGGKIQDIRIFDPSDAEARKVLVKDYKSLDALPDLIIYEGKFDESTKKVELEEKKKVESSTTLFTEPEIHQKVEALNAPGSTVFFYMARGSAHGGPLGMGAALVELNPEYPGKKQKKYNIYTPDVVDMQPVGKGQKLFDGDKPKDIAKWILEAHHKRMY